MIGRLLLIMSLLMVLPSCGEDVAYRIKGDLENLKDEKLYAVFENANSQEVDTVVCEKPGEFLIEKKSGDFEQVTILWGDKRNWVTAFLEKGKEVHISGDALYPTLLQVKGGKLNNELTDLYKDHAELWREQADLFRGLDAPEVSSIEKSDLMARIANVNLQIDETVMAYITEHPDREASLVLMQSYYMNQEHIRYLDKALEIVAEAFPDNPRYKELKDYSIRSKRAMPGSEAPDFSVKNIYGKKISLSTIKDKELLLVFTAPWADIFHAKQMPMEAFVDDFSKDYEIVMITLDTEPEDVRDLLSHSKVQWNLVTDSASQTSQLLDLYNVSSLPRIFLIDKEHKIKAKADSGEEMRKQLLKE